MLHPNPLAPWLAALGLAVTGLAATAAAQTAVIAPQTPGLVRPLPPLRAELAGRSLAAFPHFQRVRVVHEGGTLAMAVDPFELPSLAGVAADVYVVASKATAEWVADPTLVDVRAGGAQAVLFSAGGVQANTFTLDAGTLSGDAGIGLGVGYDVVIDADANGLLGAGDVIDGYGTEAGVYVVRDTSAPGPLTPVEILYSGGAFLGQNTFYPAEIATLGAVPLIVVSHGNGHNYQWYDHIGRHLASYGYVVMSHENNTIPGSDAASITTLTNTEWFLANHPTVAAGALAGHVDGERILWIGHSRGGEGVVRAYARLLLDEFASPWFDEHDVRMVMSLAPVTHISSSLSFPDDVPYVLMYGSSDNDVSGSPSASASKPFAFYERARGYKHDFYLQGAGHAYFHNGTGSCVCTGPSLLNKAEVHSYELGYVLPLVKRYAQGNVPALDFFERMDGDLRPLGVPAHLVASKEYREPLDFEHFVIDDFQTEPALQLSSSGGAVSGNVMNGLQDLMRDQDGSFTWSTAVPMNGMTRYDDGGDDGQALVFDWAAPGTSFVEFEVIPAQRDLTDDVYLSFRACQGTRHPQTDLLDGPLELTVTLRDENAVTSSIRTGIYGDVTRTYERTGSGIGAGWANEFSSIRLRLTDFQTDGTALDLGAIEAIRFELGAGFGSERGRLGIDDLEILRKKSL
jgi:dienelactone hydrolase